MKRTQLILLALATALAGPPSVGAQSRVDALALLKQASHITMVENARLNAIAAGAVLGGEGFQRRGET